MPKLKIQSKFLVISAIAALAVIATGVISNKSLHKLQDYLEASARVTPVVQRHMHMDIMHDAIHSDVILALTKLVDGDMAGVQEQRKSIKDHSDQMDKDAKQNNEADVTPEIHAALEAISGKIDAYQQDAINVLDSYGQPNHDAMRAQFEKSYEGLDSDQEKLNEMFDKWVNSVDDEGREVSAMALNIILLCSFISILAVGSVVVYADRGLFKPQQELINSMNKLANGDTNAEIKYSDRHDEIGDIARALVVFADNAKEKIRLEAVQKEQEKSQELQRKATLHQLADNFQSQVQGVINAVAAASTELSVTAEGMTNSVSQSSDLAQESVAGATETFQNVQSVASAAEEMSATIQEISAQTQSASRLISDSVEKVKNADEMANALRQSSQRVRNVIQIISNIANQINLLALNATIESARAGEAGKGFAVVANEVRNLAGQTDKSIQDIERVITDMSNSSDGVINSLAAIKDTVDKIYVSSSGIASAVEEQSAVVNDIAQNMNLATHKTQSVRENIKIVGDLSQQSEDSAKQVLGAAQDLSRQSEDLNRAVAAFISNLRA